ncbi:MAG: RNA polymerase sigma-70 factor [Reichenbachiella sp.]|uniref:RNA polymerase sigma-70 factor n=1 Tax=Reichenbachiella sp. TaxID=2184521 RepID=UPI00329A2093
MYDGRNHNAKVISLREREFSDIYQKYFERLLAYSFVITRSEDLAKDVVSEVFLNLWKSKIEIRSIKEPKAYLFTATKNQAVKILSADPKNFDFMQYEKNIKSIDRIDPEELLIGKEINAIIEKTKKVLPSQCQLVFDLIKYQNKSYKEVALELNISVETVKYHLKVALKKLRKALLEEFGDSIKIRFRSFNILLLIVVNFS